MGILSRRTTTGYLLLTCIGASFALNGLFAKMRAIRARSISVDREGSSVVHIQTGRVVEKALVDNVVARENWGG